MKRQLSEQRRELEEARRNLRRIGKDDEPGAVLSVYSTRTELHTNNESIARVHTFAEKVPVFGIKLIYLGKVAFCITTDIYPVDTVLPVHIVWHDEATAKSTTQDGRR